MRDAPGSLGAALSTAATLPPAAGRILGASARRAYVEALDVTLLVAIVGMILAALLVAYLLRPVQSELVENPDPALEAA